MKVGDLVRYKYNTREIGVIIASAEPTNQLSKQHKIFWCALPDDEPADYQYSDWMREVALEVISPT
jgi:hypothetical protein